VLRKLLVIYESFFSHELRSELHGRGGEMGIIRSAAGHVRCNSDLTKMQSIIKEIQSARLP
jgi:hypothetical protein